ncbi:MAG: hypothetical protein ABEI39_04580 [Halobacteriales archaeon]
MGAADRIRAYYDALRSGEPLAPFFAPVDGAVKFGISERLDGYEAIAAGLREQTERTTDWRVDSRALLVTERECHAWFSDVVSLGWADTERQIRYEFETRWSGTLERRNDDGRATAPADGDTESADGEWRFVGMHVSTAREL